MRSHSKGPFAVATLVALLLLLLLLLLAPSAHAAPKGIVGSAGGSTSGATGGALSTPRGVASNLTTGDIYVADGVNHRVSQFSAAGAFIRAWGQDVVVSGKPNDAGTGFEICDTTAGNLPEDCKTGITTPATANGGMINAPQGLAVDQSTGNVYVSEQGNRRVEVFSSNGAFVAAFGWDVKVGGVTTFEVCTVAAECKTAAAAGANAGQFGAVMGQLAIGPGGSVFVADAANRRVQKFSSAGAFLSAFSWNVVPPGKPGDVGTALESCPASASETAGDCQAGTAGAGIGQFSNNQPTRVAADSGGSVYTVEAAGNSRVQKFTPAASSASIFAEALLSGSPAPTDVAVDLATDHVFVVKPCSATLCPEAAVNSERRIKEFDNSGTLVDTHISTSGLTTVNGLGLGAGGSILVSSTIGGHRAYVASTLAPPTASIDPVTAIGGTTATFNGKVNPTGNSTGYHFEYSTDGVNWVKAPASDVDVGSGIADAPVSQNVSGLMGSQLYQVRLVATKRFLLGTESAGNAVSLETSFSTNPALPAVSQVGVTGITSNEATLNATLNPQNEETTYYFEYGTADCSLGGCAKTPAVDAAAGDGSADVPVSQPISGLEPGTTYHFRVVATNPTGTTTSSDRTFSTYAIGSENPRAYEMVSPPEKHGVDISHNESIQAALNGDAAVFSSLGGFADSPAATVLNYYRAERDASGWTSRGISPPAVPRGSAIVYTLMMALSDDLSRSVIRGFPAPPIAPGTQPTAPDFYRHDIPDGPFENLTPIVPDPDVFEGSAAFAGTNDAMTVVGINSNQQLTPDAPIGPEVDAYVWSGGSLHYVGVLPDGSPATNSFVGALCCLESKNAISSDGSQIVFTAHEVGGQVSVYIRKNLTSTVEASASQRTPLDPAGAKPAVFQGASEDGSKVFFYSAEQLLNSDVDSSNDLYVFEPGSGELRRVSIDENTDDGIEANVVEILGSSDDGDHVYFAARGLLVPGQEASPGTRLYAWHDDGSPDGTVSYVATLDPALDLFNWDPQIFNKRGYVQVSSEGQYLLFTAKTALGGYDNAGFSEIYLYDADSEDVHCVSCDPSTAPATGDARLHGMDASVVDGLSITNHRPHNVTDNGFVFFETEDALTPADSNGKIDVYQWHAGQLSLVSRGVGEADSRFGDASEDGGDVFFLTRDRLVGIDTDNNVDLYDARVGGGIVSQNPVSPPVCVGEACRPQGEGIPAMPAIGTSALRGAGDPPTSRSRGRKCRKGSRKKRAASPDAKRNRKGSCAKRKSKARAGQNRRVGR